ncbi:hypothetical protein Q31a_41120 [Aureliella helgolandensis]|uniref:Uncharacterized protein n=1 Tax=Aureliella helgolandensis TaxID=2527968 RepID=A0A518GB00_9BACT|nr:hypothetical protein Q31a_41120 [Aureliella helgolandensis]
MFLPVVLPVKTVLAAILAILVVVTLAAPLVRFRHAVAFFAVSGLAIVAIIPAWTAVTRKIQATRFAEFQYAASSNMTRSACSAISPLTAATIHALQNPNGVGGTFQVDEPSFLTCLHERWHAWGDSAINRGNDRKAVTICKLNRTIYGMKLSSNFETSSAIDGSLFAVHSTT